MPRLLSTLRHWLKANASLIFPLLSFIIPLMARALPEFLMGPFVTGFDTLAYYIPNTVAWLNGGVSFWTFMATAPFLYVLLMSLTSIGVPIVLSLKVMSPVLLGFLGLVVFFYASKTLSWSFKKSLLAALFATLYFVALRVSWDMLRSELGLIFLFATLILLKKDGGLRSGALLSIAMVSVVFAHQIVAIIMFAIILATVMRSYFDKKSGELRKITACSIPAACLFFIIAYANLVIQTPFVSDFLSQNPGGFMALLGFGSFTDLVVDTLGFLIFCYLPLMPLLFLGARRFKSNLQLKTWIFWVFLSLLLVIISPNAFFAILPYRWTLLLAYPLAFYAVEGFSVIKRNSLKASAGLILTILSVSFMVLPNNAALFYYDAFPTYVPKSMLQNTVPLSDCQDTVNALQWLRDNMPNNSRLLVHEVFYGWASLTLNSSQLISYGFGNPEIVAQELEENDSVFSLYLIWWVNGVGWYGQPSIASTFRQVYQSGRIAVFTFVFPSSAH